jgi:ketosteroid isomerase-like protein
VADSRAEIETLEREWRDALCRKDMDQLRGMVHPDFVLIGTRSTGPFIMHRDEWLDAIQHRDVQTIEFDVREASVMGDVLIGTVHARWKLKYLGRVIEDCVVSTDVWVREGGRWVSIRRHSTPAPCGQADSLKGK